MPPGVRATGPGRGRHPKRTLLILVATLLPARFVSAWGCLGGARPLVWQAGRGNQTAYLVSSHHVSVTEVEPVPEIVTQALQCADVAYFETACSAGDKEGMGFFMNHCQNYSISDPKDSISARLSPGAISSLQSAAAQIANAAPSECAAAAVRLRRSSSLLPSPNFRMSLRAFYLQALDVLNPTSCTLEGSGQSYEDWLRQTFGAVKPAFGLEDVNVRCARVQGDTADTDVSLAEHMAQHFSSGNWQDAFVQDQAALSEAMKCGNLDRLDTMRQLPGMHVHMVGQTNPVVARSVELAFQNQPGRTIIAAISVASFIDSNGTRSVPSLLSDAGFAVRRLFPDSSLTCSASSYAAPGAKQVGRCLMPPNQAQPETCTSFSSAMEERLGNNTMYGRSKNVAPCAQCVSSSQACTCSFAWDNTSAFRELCETGVNGVRGQVFELDLTRNPGSYRTGPAYAEKHIQSFGQNCYGSTCQVPLLQEMALRNWYKTSPSLNTGTVTLRGPGVPNPTGHNWPWWKWCIAPLGILLSISGLVACFLMPKSKGQGRRTRSSHVEVSNPSKFLGGRAPQYGGEPFEPELDAPPFPPQVPPRPASPPHDDRGAGDGRDASNVQQATSAPKPFPQAWEQPPQQSQQQFYDPPPPLRSPDAPPTLRINDDSLLMQAKEMQQRLGDAGAQAIQRMQMGALQGVQMQGGSLNISPPSPTGAMGSPQTQLLPMPGSLGPSAMPGGYEPLLNAPLVPQTDPRGFSYAPALPPGANMYQYQPLAQGDALQRPASMAVYLYGMGH